MVVRAKSIITVMEKIAPLGLAEQWDNSGWQVGDPDMPVQKIILALDVTPEVVDEAEKNGTQLIISHHPMFLKGIKSVRNDFPSGSLIFRLIRAGIGVYSAHTNLDSADGGINDILAQKLGLREVEVLHPVHQEGLLKLVVFVPVEQADAVREALGRAGAGWIGNYSDCTFNLRGAGTFRPREGTNPYIGSQGKLEHVEEVRIETVVKQKGIDRVLRAMLQAHPYEEVAYDLYPLENKITPSQGLGRLGYLPQTISLGEFARTVKELLQVNNLRYGSNPKDMVRRIAVCGGSGGDMWLQAQKKGADVLVTGDVRYHAARDMLEAGMNFIDAGHFATEWSVLPALRNSLANALAKADLPVDIIVAQFEEEPWVCV